MPGRARRRAGGRDERDDGRSPGGCPDPRRSRGISPGDVIVQVQDEKVSTPDQVQAKVAKIKKDGGKVVVVLVARSRGGQHAFVPLKIS